MPTTRRTCESSRCTTLLFSSLSLRSEGREDITLTPTSLPHSAFALPPRA